MKPQENQEDNMERRRSGICHQERWYSISASSAPFFGLGQVLKRGTALGLSNTNGQPLCVEETGKVVGVQYDVWEERVIVVLEIFKVSQGPHSQKAIPALQPSLSRDWRRSWN